MESKKSNNIAVCIICGILTTFGIVASIISLIGGSGGAWMINDVFLLVLSLLVGYYAFVGYKKPHGNLLKYIILLFAVNALFGLNVTVQDGTQWIAILIAIRVGLLCYIAGRLVKVKENLILMIIFTVIGAVLCIWQFVTSAATIGLVAGPVIWFDICAAYFLRYKSHKEIGLSNAPTKQ